MNKEQIQKILDEAPEGAQRYSLQMDRYYKVKSYSWYDFVGGGWSWRESPVIEGSGPYTHSVSLEDLRAQLERVIEYPAGYHIPEQEWVDGLPPVGEVCEFKKHFEDEKHFSECFIVGYRHGAQTKTDRWMVFSDKYDNLHQHHCDNGVYVFRKPETPEQKEARLREEAISEMPISTEDNPFERLFWEYDSELKCADSKRMLFKKYLGMVAIMVHNSMYEAGYRKQ